MAQETAEQTIERVRTESQRISRQNVYVCEIIGAPSGANAWNVVTVELRAGGWSNYDVLARLDLSQPYQRSAREERAAALDALSALNTTPITSTTLIACEDDLRGGVDHTICHHY